MSTKTTICIPSYNAGSTIAETLDSLLAQTYSDFEIIVSDNYSTDNTQEVVDRYKKFGVHLATCPILPVKTGHSLDNARSAIQNWNSLVNLGRGEYVGIFHADDVYHRTIVLKEIEFLENHPECSAVFPTCLSLSFLHGSDVSFGTEAEHSLQSVDIFNQPELVKAMLRRGHFMSSSGPLIRRKSWIKAGKIDVEQFEQACDSEFWIRISGVGPIGIINYPLVLRRIHSGMESRNGLQLYRYRPLPIIKVLEFAVNLSNVKNEIFENDNIHKVASRMEQDLRIALNLIEDEHYEEARLTLKRLPRMKYSLILELWKGHRKLQLWRLFSGKCLGIALQCGVGEFFAKKIANSRVGFPEWSKK